MDLTLNFANYGTGVEDGIRVYRAAAPILDGALPAALATLPAGSTQYVDTTAVRGSKYYYRFGSYKGTDETLTPNAVIRAVPATDTGPGPQKLIMGDWDIGYFGICKSSDLITYANLAAYLGITTGTVVTGDYDWMKMAIRGKVLFIARSIYLRGIAYNDLYLKGAVYGTNDNGLLVPTGAAATNQYKPFQIGSVYTLVPRILKGLPDNAAIPTQIAAPGATIQGQNEWDDAMGMMFFSQKYTTDVQNGLFGRIDEITYPGNSGVNWFADHCQQPAGFSNLATSLVRGARVGGNTLTVPACVGTGAVASATYTNALFGAGGSCSPCWRPVLELVL